MKGTGDGEVKGVGGFLALHNV